VIPISIIPGVILVSVAADVIPVSVAPVPIARAVVIAVPDVMLVWVVPILMARWPASARITVDDGDCGGRAVVDDCPFRDSPMDLGRDRNGPGTCRSLFSAHDREAVFYAGAYPQLK
jgi:hypothetical protein